jgi:hypothetical protein
MSINFEEILKELEYRVEHGIIDLSKEQQVTTLAEILRENGVADANEMAQKARVYFSYINEEEVVKNKKSGNIYVVNKMNPSIHTKPTPAEVNKAKKANGGKLPTEKSATKAAATPTVKGTSVFGKGKGADVFDKPAKSAGGKQRMIGGKDKTLAKVDTLRSKAFLQKQQPDDATFASKNKKFQLGPPPPPYKIPNEAIKNAKVPPRHLKALERMMNTKFSNDTAKWSHFSDLPGGAGQISAQAGELMTMIGTTMDDKSASIFYKSLLDHEANQLAKNPNLKNEGTRIVTKSWITAAMNNRKAIRSRLAKEYPGATIEAGAWDTEGEVEAMGLSNYKKNKGYSTDAYFKIKTKNGESILDEVSLKKSTAVNFLNSGTGKLLEWDKNLPDNINPNVYQQKERKNLFTFGSKNVKALKKAALKDKELQATLKAKKITLDDALAKLKAGKGSRDINKVVMASIASAAKQGDAASKKYLDLVQKNHKQHQHDVITALGSNKKLKQGMLESIREEFPLKAVGEGEESMAIGPNSMDRAILTKIFNTSDFELIKQGLVAITNEEPPYLAYRAGTSKKVIPIATIGVREDGVGYGGQIKFEMQLDKRFAKILEQANKETYG